MDDAEVDGEGGPGNDGAFYAHTHQYRLEEDSVRIRALSDPVTTLGGFLIRCEILFRRLVPDGSKPRTLGEERGLAKEGALLSGLDSVLSLRMTSSLACFRIGRFL